MQQKDMRVRQELRKQAHKKNLKVLGADDDAINDVVNKKN